MTVGRLGRGGWSLAVRPRVPPAGRALQVEDVQDEYDAVERVQSALEDAGMEGVSFVAEISPTGWALLHLLDTGPSVDAGIGPYPSSLILVEGSVPEPWRRLPSPVPEAMPAPSAELALLKRTLEERLDGAIGATEAEIAAVEERLGIALPDELKVLYRVTRAHWQDWDDGSTDDGSTGAERLYEAVGCELFALDDVYVADAASRPCPWEFAAMEAVSTPPDAPVQGVVGSPGWIAFGDNGGGDRIAVDLPPGPRGHVGQVIMLSHEHDVGACLLADSLTDFVSSRGGGEEDDHHRTGLPAVARVNARSLTSVEAAAHPELEVLSIGFWEGEPLSLAPVTGWGRRSGVSSWTAEPSRAACPPPPSRCAATRTRSR